MHECPWCGYQNLNVYAYCLRCGRGWAGPEQREKKTTPGIRQRLWPFGPKAA
jgi:uncharacterized membrane protein YvbJ